MFSPFCEVFRPNIRCFKVFPFQDHHGVLRRSRTLKRFVLIVCYKLPCIRQVLTSWLIVHVSYDRIWSVCCSFYCFNLLTLFLRASYSNENQEKKRSDKEDSTQILKCRKCVKFVKQLWGLLSKRHNWSLFSTKRDQIFLSQENEKRRYACPQYI